MPSSSMQGGNPQALGSAHLPAGHDVPAAGRDDALQCDVQRAHAAGCGHDGCRLCGHLDGRCSHRVLQENDYCLGCSQHGGGSIEANDGSSML